MTKKKELLKLLDFGQKRSHHDYTELLSASSCEQNRKQHKQDNMATHDAETELPDDEREKDKEKKTPYPKQIFYIISMEACERFSYYGMNAILTLYLINLFARVYETREKAENVSTTFYHFYKFGCYASGLIGALLADSFVGKYRTILWVGIMYAFGQAILSFGAVGNGDEGIKNFPNMPVSFIGMALIALGTGGIKPCVVALGADQFKVPEQNAYMTSYFAMFYASINFGSLVATIVTPYLRGVHCMGDESCYTLAFGVPAALMIIAIFFFWFGRNQYKKPVPERNVVKLFFQCSWHAIIRRRYKTRGQHWLDVANDKFDQQIIDEFKAVYRVGVLFLFYPMYWALFDQQGSRWTIQAMRMNGFTFGWQILPDQMQVANPILIILCIPLFDKIIYPLLGKCGILKTPLQRIVTGCVLCGAAFIVSGVLELQLKKGYPELPDSNQLKLFVHNGLDCPLEVNLPNYHLQLSSHETIYSFINKENENLVIPINPSSECTSQQSFNIDVPIQNIESKTVMIYKDRTGNIKYIVSEYEDRIKKDNDDPMPFVRVISGLNRECRVGFSVFLIRNRWVKDLDLMAPVGDTEVTKLTKTRNHTLMVSCLGSDSWQFNYTDDYKVGASYNLFLTDEETVTRYNVVEDNKIHIMWLLPQYIVVTVGEILFSITSLQFAYSQAPPSMKSVLQALFLMTTAVGNLITLVIVEIFSAFELEQQWEFFTFAGLMMLFSLSLAIVAYRYEYNYYTDEEVSETNTTASDDE